MNPEVEMVNLGAILDGIGVQIEALHEGDLVESAMVIIKIVDKDGMVSVGLADSKISWIEQLGLLAAADHVLRHHPPTHRDPEI